MSSMENISDLNIDPITAPETEVLQGITHTNTNNPLSSSSAVPVVDMDSEKSFKEQALSVIKQIDGVVEKLRMEAFNLETKKESLLSMLDSLKHSNNLTQLPEEESNNLREMIHGVRSRLTTVDVRISTQRTKTQEEALHRVNVCIDTLILQLQNDPVNTENTCRTFIRTCLSDKEKSEHHEEFYFRSAIRECALEDQNKIWRRLQGLLNYIENWQKSLGLELLE